MGMAPHATCLQHPASDSLSMMDDHLGFVTEEPVEFLGLPALNLHPRRKRLEADSLDRRRMLQVFRKAFRHLRAALFKVLNRCTAAVKTLYDIGLPSHRMTAAVASVSMASLVPYKPMKDCREDKGSIFQGVVWTPAVLRDAKIVEEEEDSVAAADKIMEGDCLGETMTEELVCALVDWPEWDTSEEELCMEIPLKIVNGFPLSCLEINSVPSPITPSDEEVEWDSDSSWDDDDSDDSETNSKLWESFMVNDDPYNPFRCSWVTAVNDRHIKVTEHSAQRPLQMSSRWEGVGEAEEGCSPEVEKTAVSSKKVRFSDIVKVHPLVTWGFASRAARDGSCWQEMARDRARFKRRVGAVGEIISPCLLPEHRAMVWKRVHLL